MRVIFQSLLLIPLLVTTGCIGTRHHETSSEKVPNETRDEFLDPGHGRLHFHFTRGKLPAILLESGACEDSSQWKSLQPDIARLTGLAVVSYDRPGFGTSELPSAAYDATVEMQDLKAALDRLGVGREVILVGHSYGGLLNQLYASQNPKSVCGVVLIEPNTVEWLDAIGGPQVWGKEIPKNLPEPVEANKRAFAGLARAVEVFRVAAFPSNVPIVVITAGKRSTDEQDRLFAVAHENIVRGNPTRSLVVADGSGHMVTADRPDVILSAITNIVTRIH